MRRLFFTVSLLALCASPAFAAKKQHNDAEANTITVIQEDGTAVTIELEEPEVLLPGEAEPFDMPARSSPPSAPPVETRAVQPPPPPPEPPAPPEVQPRPYVDEIVAPSAEQKPAPAPAKKEKPEKKKKTAEPPPKAEKPKHPKPPRAPQQKAVQQNLAPGSEITERMASSIAFDHAPPSSGFTTARQTYEGKPVYVVTFATEDGPYDVLVDAATGNVVVSAYVETHEPRPTAPGHLPQDWKPYAPQPVGKTKGLNESN